MDRVLGANRVLRVHRHASGSVDEYGDATSTWTPGAWVRGNLGEVSSTELVDGRLVTRRNTRALLPPTVTVGDRDLVEAQDQPGVLHRVESAVLRRWPSGRLRHLTVRLIAESSDAI